MVGPGGESDTEPAAEQAEVPPPPDPWWTQFTADPWRANAGQASNDSAPDTRFYSEFHHTYARGWRPEA
eukprot:5264102-Alexandrium_andersonii.AAC.1